jgi:hypothetical protein
VAALGVDDRWATDPRAFWMRYVGAASRLGDAVLERPPNSDDWPRFEYLAGRSRLRDRRAFLREGWSRLADAARADAPESDLRFPGAPGPGAEAGNAFARATLLAMHERGPRVRAARRKVRRLVPADLLEDHDPSVAEVWP